MAICLPNIHEKMYVNDWQTCFPMFSDTFEHIQLPELVQNTLQMKIERNLKTWVPNGVKYTCICSPSWCSFTPHEQTKTIMFVLKWSYAAIRPRLWTSEVIPSSEMLTSCETADPLVFKIHGFHWNDVQVWDGVPLVFKIHGFHWNDVQVWDGVPLVFKRHGFHWKDVQVWDGVPLVFKRHGFH